MPDLDKYERSIKDYDDSSDEFKPFREVSDSMPYPHGQCTWYVYNRMKQFGTSISGDLGDAHNWNNRAQYRDYQVSHTQNVMLLLYLRLDNLVQINITVM